ncbi:S phase cyclin A-associated protein in the endoplasmic reticulum-like isoform X2 [Lineus longissimus]|uniref:S phase cyclin A-associated protein in the endoplasmic reticulum-like isoform X2 n=1 Tax=Lineus longissimus TaxID=88925 RepID=UPI00315DC616
MAIERSSEPVDDTKTFEEKPNYQRTTSHDRVRKIVQEEGRAARNLIAYNVPVEDEENLQFAFEQGAQRFKSQYLRKSGGKALSLDRATQRTSARGSMKLRESSSPVKRQFSEIERNTPRRSSTGTSSKKPDLRARYWAFLFDNLQRAVDEIYKTCEADESEVECKEVIMMLEQCTKDFKSLIERLKVIKAFETADDDNKPTSLAWEVRKTSPGKMMPPPSMDRKAIVGTAQRVLHFGTTPQQTPASTNLVKDAGTQIKPSAPSLAPLITSPPGNSWADKVKGIKSPPPVAAPQAVVHSKCVTVEELEEKMLEEEVKEPKKTVSEPKMALSSSDEDTDGWETVHRSNKNKNRNSPAQKTSSIKFKSCENLSKTGTARQQSVPCPKPNGRPGLQHKSTSESNLAIKLARNSPPVESNQTKRFSNRSPVQGGRPRTISRDSEKENKPREDATRTVSVEVVAQSAPIVNNIKKDIVSNGINSMEEKRSDTHDEKVEKNTKSDALKILPKDAVVKMDYPAATKQTVILSDEFGIQMNEALKSRGTRSLELDTDGEDNDDDDDEDNAIPTELDELFKSVMNAEHLLNDELHVEEEQERALQSAMHEEETYLKAIEREEKEEIIVETETETETESELGNTMSSVDFKKKNVQLDWDSMLAQYDAEAEQRESLNWGEMVEIEEGSERTPGHSVHMHEKLSSPSRKRSPGESRKRHEEKQQKAQELRERLLQEKAERLRELSKKVEQVQSWKEELYRQRRVMIQQKMQHAEEKRTLQIRQKVKKAHEEETKANEIAFINTLEAQNKRHDIMSKHEDVEARLQEIQEERQRKHEEKAAKEAAVEERRKAIEAERIARLIEMQERRKQREVEIEQKQAEKEKERLETARMKEKDREERMAALNAQQQAHIEELKVKIQQKQDESTRRHNEKLGQIREKAFEMSVLRHSTEDHNDAPKLTPYDKKKLCSLCNVLLPSEVHLLSHLRGKKHQQSLLAKNHGKELSREVIETFNLRHITDAPSDRPDPRAALDKERQKALKKRCKKLRQRMTVRGIEYENALAGKQPANESEHKAKMQKIIKDVNKYLQTQGSGPWPQNRLSALDRATGELLRILEKKAISDQIAFRYSGGVTSLCRILLLIDQSTANVPPVIPSKSLALCLNVLKAATKGCYENCHYMLFSNKIGSLVDLLIHRLVILLPDGSSLSNSMNSISSSQMNKLPNDPVATGLMQLLAAVLACLAKNNPSINSSEASAERMSGSGDALNNRANDIISYVISVGIVDRLHQYFINVHEPIDDDPEASEFLQHSIGLLIAMIRFMSLSSKRNQNIFDKKNSEDPSHLIQTFSVTELFGIVSLLYGMLLHSGAPVRRDASPPELPGHTVSLTCTAIRMLNQMAILDLKTFQSALGEEGTWLEFRHICSYLLWYCSHWSNEDLLHEVILSVGYFAVLSTDNQQFIQSGQPPTVLQQLCSLPFQYFSDPRLTNVLFPTLVSCCYNNQANREILEKELSCALLSNFMEEKKLEAQQAKLQNSKKTAKLQDKDKAKEVEPKMALPSRFPVESWDDAQEYFKAT